MKDSKWGRKCIFDLSIVQAVTEVLYKSRFSLQMGNCPIQVAEHSELRQATPWSPPRAVVPDQGKLSIA